MNICLIIQSYLSHYSDMASKNIILMLRTLNLITGAGLIVLSVLAIIDVKNLFSFKVFLIPCPFFIGLFGFAIIGAELKAKIILKHMAFLKSLMGRGLFNVFLSSMAFWFLQSSEALAWVSALILFIVGVIYIAFHFGYGKQFQQEQQKQEAKTEQGRKNLI